MSTSKRILIVFDGSEDAWRAARYVAGLADGCPGFEVCVFHLLPGPPPALREHPGAEDPAEERRLSRELQEAAAQWVEENEQKAERMLDEVRMVFQQAGLADGSIKVRVEPDHGEKKTADLYIDAAREESCGTVAIGRTQSHHFAERLFGEAATRLVKKGEGLAVWVVE